MDEQKRRYTFGNDEFSLEAAYHDCKLVFDGITDDDSFQETDTGLILYYANEIIYALHEALAKDTNVLSNDCISRQAAVSEIMDDLKDRSLHDDDSIPEDYAEGYDEGIRNAAVIVQQLPFAQPETHDKRTETHACDCISRQEALEALGDEPEVWTDSESEIAERNQWRLDVAAIKAVPSAQPEIRPIDYQDCSNAMLKMWMDNVVTDGEYNRIMDKLNAHWGKRDG